MITIKFLTGVFAGETREVAEVQKGYQDNYGSSCIVCGSPAGGRASLTAYDDHGNVVARNYEWDDACSHARGRNEFEEKE